MSQPSSNSPGNPNDPSSQVAAAAAAVARDEADARVAARAGAGAKRRTPGWVAAISVLALVAALVANWNAMRGPAVDPETERREGMTTLEYVAQRIRAEADSLAALPATLESIGLGDLGIDYTPRTDGFRLLLITTAGDSVVLDQPYAREVR